MEPLEEVRQRAIVGTVQDLEDFADRVNKDNFTLDDFDVFLRQFDKDLIPPHEQSERDARRAELSLAQGKVLVATQQLWRLLITVKADSSLRERFLDSVADRLIGALDGLVAWIEQFHLPTGFSEVLGEPPNRDFSMTYLTSGFLLLELASIQSPRSWNVFLDLPAAVFLDLPAAVDLALTAWITPIHAKSWQGEVGPYPFGCTSRILPSYLRCPIITFMIQLVSTRERRRVLVDKVEQQGEALAEWIVWGASKRMVMLDLFVGPGFAWVTAETAAKHFLGLLEVIHSLGEEPVFRKAIHRSWAWTWTKESIQTISNHGGERLTVLTMIYTALFYAKMTSSKKTSDLYELLSSFGVMDVLVRTIQQPLSEDGLGCSLAILEILKSACHRPNVPRWLASVVGMCREDARMLETHPQEELANNWRSFKTQLKSARRIARKIRPKLRPIGKLDDSGNDSRRERTQVYFCDNPLCPSPIDLETEPPRNSSQKCTNCHSVVYCSLDCQKVDWKARHREECALALEEYNRQHSDGSWYGPRKRAYHLAYIEEYYESLSLIQRHVCGPGIMLDIAQGATPVLARHPSKSDFLRPDARTSQHNKARYDEVFEEMKHALEFDVQNGQLPATRYIEMIYNWGSGKGLVMLMVKLRPVNSTSEEMDKAFKAIYSVPRVIYRARKP